MRLMNLNDKSVKIARKTYISYSLGGTKYKILMICMKQENWSIFVQKLV